MVTSLRNLTVLILVPPLLLTVFSFISLLTSPYTGLRFLSLEQKTEITAVDPGSPAARAGIRSGDRILAVNGRDISYPAMVFDPDYISTRNDLKRFWETQRWLDLSFDDRKDVTLLIEKGGGRSEVTLTSTHFTPGIVAGRIWDGYLISWMTFIMFFLLFRKKRNEITTLFLILGMTVVGGGVSADTYQTRDLAFPFLAFRLLDVINGLTLFLYCLTLIHLSFVFPRRRAIVEKYPYLVEAIYGLTGFLFISELLGLFDNPSLITSFLAPLSKNVFVTILIVSFLSEKNPVYRKQIQWVVLGFFASIIPRVILVELPTLYSGAPLVPGDNILFMLTTLFLPASIIIAVTRYRLMDIDVIFDKVVIYGLVLAVLGGIEWTFLSSLSGYYVNGIWTLPYAPLLLVIPIVFLYIPVRNGVRKGVQRLFKRREYRVEEEVRKFNLSIGMNPEIPVLEKFFILVMETLVPSGVCIMKRSSTPVMSQVDPEVGGFSICFVDGAIPEKLSQEIANTEDALWRYFEERRSTTYGYELLDRGILKSSNFLGSLWVPIFVKKRLAYLVFLHERWCNTAYSINDRALLEAVSMSAGPILEAEEMRKDLGKAEERFQKHRDHVMREIHDGLGSILAHITMASQVLERSYREEEETAQKMIGIISESSREATDFLRAGLNILDLPEGRIGEIIPDMKHRLGNMLRAYGIDLEVNVTDEVQEMKIAADQSLHLFRCLQETIHNVLKHSEASQVSIAFCKDEKHLRVSIADDGKGFEVTPQSLQGYGLENMLQRMEGLGGVFEVLSSPGRGTRLTFSIPVSPSPEIRPPGVWNGDRPL
jgi:signal transduction histidine kinase